MTTWITRWRDEIAAEPDAPGVWRRKEGGFRIRGRTTDPKTGERREVNRALPDCKRAREAGAVLEAELAKIAAGTVVAVSSARPRFDEWCATVFERKVRDGAIESARGRDKWESVLRVHLIPAFGSYYVDKLSREDIEQWKTRELLAERTKTKDAKRDRELSGKRYKPQTANTIMGVLRQVMSAAAEEFNFHDPCSKLANVSTRRHRTYSYEAPNALKPDDVPRFLAEMRTRYPDHYAFAFLGFTTGLRPSSLRPLRRRGELSDVKWSDGRLLVRQSHTKGSEVMDLTKTAEEQVIDLDPEQVAVLRWHCDRLDAQNAERIRRGHNEQAEAMAASDLLFPAAPTRWNHGGGFRSGSVLDRPFAHVAKLLELGYPVSPKAMRRTFNDMARAAKVHDAVTRSITGHKTPQMQQHYSTAGASEQREALAKVIEIATRRERKAA